MLRFYLALILIYVVGAVLSGDTPSIILDRVIVEVDGVASPRRVREVLGFKRGQVIADDDIEEALERLSQDGRYESITTDIRPGRKDRSELIVSIVVDPGRRPPAGEPIRIDKVELTGNWKTRRNVILSEFLFDEGDTVRLETIEESVQRVFNRDFFFEIDWGLYEDAGLTVMELRVREKWTLFPVIFFRGDDELTQLSLGGVDLNVDGRGFFLLGNYTGSFYRSGGSDHNVNFLYFQDRMAGTPFSTTLSAGYVTTQNYISSDGTRIADFSQTNIYLNSKVGYNWLPDFRTSIIIGYGYDKFSGDYVLDVSAPEVGGFLEFDRLDLYDVRNSGFRSRAASVVVIPDAAGGEPYLRSDVSVDYYQVFLKDLLYFSSRGGLSHSNSQKVVFQVNREKFLRGASAREYFSPLVYGGIMELSVAPIRKNWLFLELAGFFDFSWNDDGEFMYRWGPGFRITFPPLAGLTAAFDYSQTERGETEIYFGMVRFLNTR